jgi:hypothetical protein
MREYAIFALCLALCLSFGSCLKKDAPRIFTAASGQAELCRMSLAGIGREDLRSIGPDFRIYVGREGDRPRKPRLLVRVHGLNPGSKVYWHCGYVTGPLNDAQAGASSFLSAAAGHAFHAAEVSSLADGSGRAAVEFTGTTYAGDRFRLGWGLKPHAQAEASWHGPGAGGVSLTVWKRLYLEPVKVLKNVRFPASVWERVSRRLAAINIELRMAGGFEEIDPWRRELAGFFHSGGNGPGRGPGFDPRYGPLIRPWQEQGMVLKDLARLTSDGDSETISVVVLGAFSRGNDLIADAGVEPPSPRPVDYAHRYLKHDLNLDELSQAGMGSAIGGDCPAIFIWSDFWWLVSRVLKLSHEETLERVILHELGHQLLNALPSPASALLDENGHLYERFCLGKTIMGGFGPLLTSNQRAAEKKFIRNPGWHDRVEILIRGGYLPRRQ